MPFPQNPLAANFLRRMQQTGPMGPSSVTAPGPQQNPLAASLQQYMQMQQPHMARQQATYNPSMPQPGFNAQAGLQQGRAAGQQQWAQWLQQLAAAQQARQNPPPTPTQPGVDTRRFLTGDANYWDNYVG